MRRITDAKLKGEEINVKEEVEKHKLKLHSYNWATFTRWFYANMENITIDDVKMKVDELLNVSNKRSCNEKK